MRRIPPLPTIALAALVLLHAAPDAAAGPAPNRPYRDPVHKFSLKVFPDWAQVPIEPGEEVVVASFAEGGADKGFAFAPRLRVVRVPKGEKAKGPDITGLPEGAPRGFPGQGPPATAWDAVVSLLPLRQEKPLIPAKFKEIESRDKVPGRLYAVEIPFPTWQGQPPEILVGVLGTFEKDEIEYGVFLACSQGQGGKYLKGFEQVVKSFRFFDDKAEDVEVLDVLDGVNITAKRRRQIERSKIKGWDVIVSPKKQYIVIYNTKNGKNAHLGRIIAERIERIREQVYEVQFPPSQPITAVSIVRVCKDAKEYHAYGGPGGSAGYWSSGTEELVFYDASPAKKIDENTLAVLYHEAFHQFIYYSVGEVAPHSWFNEGHGDYYAGAKYKNGKFTIEPFAWRVGVVKGAIVQGPRPFTLEKGEDGKERKAWGNQGYTPIEDLVRFSQGEYYSYAGVSYAQGWSLVYFLREIVPKNKKYNEKWGKILPTYFDTLKAEVNRGGQLVPRGVGAPPGDGGDEPAEPDDEPAGPESPEGPEPGDSPAPPGADPTPPVGPGGEEGPSDPGIPQTYYRGVGGPEALEKAVSEAFKGVDWEEFEKAWKESTKGVSG